MTLPKYIIITPAWNVEAHIEKTITSVICQTIPPQKWIIVNDGSKDNTEDIVRKYSNRHEFIQLIGVSGGRNHNFSSKVQAFNAGYSLVRDMEYAYIGNLDADVSFTPNYYERILEKLEEDPRLGIAGGSVYENIGGKLVCIKTSLDSVPGAIQLFRRQCFEEIRGYRALELGGVDTVAETMARCRHWKVQKFKDLKVIHHGRVGFSNTNKSYERFILWGKMHYGLGYHPVFHMFRCIYRMHQRPYVVSGLLSMYGFLRSWIKKDEMAVSKEFALCIRQEQIQRLISMLHYSRKSD